MSVRGKIHSIETMGTVDGPGIRYVIFMQGCPLRCIFCHNRDAWDPSGGKEMTVDELILDIKKYTSFMEFSGGGVTATGGEPTLQPEFITELFSRVKEMGLNTAMDTSGFVDIPKVKKLLDLTDLILLSIKHIQEERHKEITGVGTQKILTFLDHMREIGKPVWIRYVIIPGYTDDEDDIHTLAQKLQEYNNIELVDILPYHTLGVYKWEAMGLEYPLKGVSAPDKEAVEKAKDIFKEYGFSINVEG
jgi:pyruvate formate lyase activating enzyme